MIILYRKLKLNETYRVCPANPAPVKPSNRFSPFLAQLKSRDKSSMVNYHMIENTMDFKMDFFQFTFQFTIINFAMLHEPLWLF